MNRIVKLVVYGAFCLSPSLLGTVGAVIPGQPLWGVTKRVGETVDIIESKVCLEESQLDVIESKVDAIVCPSDASLLEIIESKICEIDSQLDVIESSVDAIVVVDNSSLVELIESKVCEIDSQVDVIESKVDAIVCPSDASLLEIIESKVCEIDSQLDVIESSVDVIDASSACNPTSITAAGTISSSGFYCLANAISGSITIAASDVVLDLNNYTVSDGVTVNGSLDRVTIKNGEVSGSGDAILVNGGTSGITIADVVVKNAIRGINLNNVTSGLISNCEMTLNTTGLELDTCHKITVKDCVASCNTHAGYDLLSSTTNCFDNCKALSTGEGNTNVVDNNVFGFVSANGYGNIFERCIANSTQALTTTDFDSIIAGFALRGTEGCTKIVGCEAANSVSEDIGSTKPSGIFLEATLDQLRTVTEAFPQNVAQALTFATWSPDGKFVAVCGVILFGDNVRVFEFDRVTNDITEIAEEVTASTSEIAWAPDSKFIAAAVNSGDHLRVLKFDPIAGTLTTVGGSISAGSVNGIAWSPNGSFIAIGGMGLTGGTGDEVQIFEFRPETVDFVAPVAGIFSTGNTLSIDWSPDNRFIAVGGSGLTGGTGDEVQILEFDKAVNTLTAVAGALGTAGSVNGVRWSPDGKFVAVGGSGLTGGSGDEVQLLSFEQVDATFVLTPLTGALGTAGSVSSVAWSADGRYIVVGGGALGGTGNDVQIIEFDRGINTLTPIAGIFTGANVVNEVSWSPDGGFIAAAGEFVDDEFKIITALSFPEKNIIKNNVVYCNSNLSAVAPRGVGISGSNIVNMIMENKSYNNPQSYNFVTNVFDGLSDGIPSFLQNTGILGCKAPCITTDIAQEILIMKAKVCDMQSKIDAILLAV